MGVIKSINKTLRNILYFRLSLSLNDNGSVWYQCAAKEFPLVWEICKLFPQDSCTKNFVTKKKVGPTKPDPK